MHCQYSQIYPAAAAITAFCIDTHLLHNRNSEHISHLCRHSPSTACELWQVYAMVHEHKCVYSSEKEMIPSARFDAGDACRSRGAQSAKIVMTLHAVQFSSSQLWARSSTRRPKGQVPVLWLLWSAVHVRATTCP